MSPACLIALTASERLLTILKAALDFFYRVFSFVLVFDVCGDGPSVTAQQIEDGNDGGIALPPHGVWTLIVLAVFNMQRHDPAMILTQEVYCVEVGCGEVADVKIHGDECGSRFRCFLEALRRGNLIRVAD